MFCTFPAFRRLSWKIQGKNLGGTAAHGHARHLFSCAWSETTQRQGHDYELDQFWSLRAGMFPFLSFDSNARTAIKFSRADLEVYPHDRRFWHFTCQEKTKACVQFFWIFITRNLPSPGTKLDCEIAARHKNVEEEFLAHSRHRTLDLRIAILEKQVTMKTEDDDGGRKGLYSRNSRWLWVPEKLVFLFHGISCR